MRQPLTIRLDARIASAAKNASEFHHLTLTGYIEALIQNDLRTRCYPGAEFSSISQCDAWLMAYSTGRLSRQDVEEKTGLWFGEILDALRQRRLSLPKVHASAYLNTGQTELYHRIFGSRE